MSKFEIRFLKSIKTGQGLIKLVRNLRVFRWSQTINTAKRFSLSKFDRNLVLEKTDRRCHVCGIELNFDNFQADHVKIHSLGGEHKISNYLPSCQICNKYRWHYSPEEIQLILRLGVWAKGQLLRDSTLAREIANEFVKHEMKIRKRRTAKI